jgi:MATE family multidrug resistance protein
MLYAAICFWLIGFTSAYALAFPLRLGTVGIWIGFSLSVTMFAALLVRRFHQRTADGAEPVLTPSSSMPRQIHG